MDKDFIYVLKSFVIAFIVLVAFIIIKDTNSRIRHIESEFTLESK